MRPGCRVFSGIPLSVPVVRPLCTMSSGSASMLVTGAAQKCYLCERDVTEVAGGFIRMVDAPGFLRCGDRQFATCASIQRSVVEDARTDRDAQKRFGLEMKAVADGAQQRANDREKRFAADLKSKDGDWTRSGRSRQRAGVTPSWPIAARSVP